MCIVVADEDLHHSAESGPNQTDVLLGSMVCSVHTSSVRETVLSLY